MSKSVFVLLEESKEDQSIEVLLTADSYDQIKMMISEVELRHLGVPPKNVSSIK